MLIAPLLFYRKASKYIEAICFKVNLYDPCVSNKMIKNKQMEINWHVNDLKVSRDDKSILDSFIQ